MFYFSHTLQDYMQCIQGAPESYDERAKVNRSRQSRKWICKPNREKRRVERPNS